MLERLKLLKRITVGPRGISFDATQTIYYLLEGLEYELKHPTPMACGIDPHEGSYTFRISAKFSPEKADSEIYTMRKENGHIWEKGKINPNVVYLQLPLYDGPERNRKGTELNAKEIAAYFRTFIKDQPPSDFLSFRREIRRKTKRLRQESARTIALGLISHEFASLPNSQMKEIAEWFAKSSPVMSFLYPGNETLETNSLAKALYHAKDRISCLIQRAREP